MAFRLLFDEGIVTGGGEWPTRATGAIASAGRVAVRFSLDYKAIPITDPKQFHTASDSLADELLPAIQEPVPQGHGTVV
jgi:hypothetical protein